MTTTVQIAKKHAAAREDGSVPAVAVEDLRKSFGTQKVLSGIRLTVSRGETLAVLGRSGTGKSVLLKLIIGLEKPDSGSVRIHGQDIAGLALDRLGDIRKKMGFLFQHAALYDSLTVEQNVAFPLEHHRKKMSQSERRDRVKELLAEVGMEGNLEKMPSDLSGGMQKRVGLARALAGFALGVRAAGLRTTIDEPLSAWTVSMDASDGAGFALSFAALAPSAVLDAGDDVVRVGGMQGYESYCRVTGSKA